MTADDGRQTAGARTRPPSAGSFYKLAVLGYPVAHSLSPRMHEAALRALGLAGEYRALPVPPEQLAQTLAQLGADGYRGVNVTIPHKQAVLPAMDELTEAARAIGAVNTIVVDAGRLCGHNTDASGFLRGLDAARFDPQRRTALVLGAGGAARAVVYALGQAGARVLVWNRTAARARQLALEFGAEFCADPSMRVDLLVNCTASGMTPHADERPVVLPDRLDGTVVYDLVYRPRETLLLREARARGAQTIGGGEMLLQQGAEALRLWTGREPPLDVMRAALEGD